MEDPESVSTMRSLRLSLSGKVVRHLGLQMYTRAAPSLLELVANAWDADAHEVKVVIPFDRNITPEDVIEVFDDGCGMSYEDCRDKYLNVGRPRREEEGTDKTPEGRRLLGRKGLGKLAGFGIARVVEVWTVRDRWTTSFSMDFEDITSANTYDPPMLADRPVNQSDPVQRGTLIRLKALQIPRIHEASFMTSMVRRFALYSDTFGVYVNGRLITRADIPLALRIPETGFAEEDIAGFGKVRWWVGFAEKPIREDEMSGVAVYARGKIAQNGFFFEFARGVTGQIGMQYMTGEVHAETVDEDVDLIGTDRSKVRFEDPVGALLLAWGKKLIRDSLEEWSRFRAAERLKKSERYHELQRFVDSLPRVEKKVISQAVDKIATVDGLSNEEFDQMVGYLLRGYQYDSFHDLINTINATEESALPQLMNLMSEWDVLEAVEVAHVVWGRVKIIDKFGEMIDQGVREKPDMQNYLKAHPWLLNPSWDMLRHESTVDKIVADILRVEPDRDSHRLDFFCLGSSEQYVVVEAKRPGELAGVREVDQLERYVDALARHARASTDTSVPKMVKGVLVAGRFDEASGPKRDRLASFGMTTLSWHDLLRQARKQHESLFDTAKRRAPQDKRIQRLEVSGPAAIPLMAEPLGK
jgi:hypothetical protein